MDLEPFRRWYEYSIAGIAMLEAADSEHAPRYIVRSDDKWSARLNCIRRILNTIPHERLPQQKVTFP